MRVGADEAFDTQANGLARLWGSCGRPVRVWGGWAKMVDVIGRGRGGTPRLQRERRDGLTAKRRTIFLDHLAATCNVSRACRAADVWTQSMYAYRRRDPVFAEQWRAALLTGYDRLEAALLEHAMRGVVEVDCGEVPEQPFDPAMAMALLKMHDARRVGLKKPVGPKVRRATEAETDEAILKQLAALRKRVDAAKA